MSKEQLAFVIGRAVLDQDFAASLKANPQAAIQSVGADLTSEELQAVEDLSPDTLKAASVILQDKLPENAFVDQQQQQVQAQMD
jgi:hypothetical protein